jgi:ribosomal protein L21E
MSESTKDGGRVLGEFAIGERVQLHPAMDAWMQGDRYGEVRGWSAYRVLVLMDKSGRTLKVYPDNLTHI